MLTAYNANYPRKWSEMSFDFKGMFVYHLSMMLMMISGQAVPAAGKITIACAIIAGVGVLSASRRRALGWRWRRPGFRAIATGMAGLIAVGFFLGSAIPLYSPFNPNLLPWYLVGLGIALFGLLISLHVSFLAEKTFSRPAKDQ